MVNKQDIETFTPGDKPFDVQNDLAGLILGQKLFVEFVGAAE